MLTQSKRFPLSWDYLSTRLATWRELLPPTRSPDAIRQGEEEDWVWKPALGHEGADIGVAGANDPADWRRIVARARRARGSWVAQRRFTVLPLTTPEGPYYPCVGVYVIDGRAAGAYGRLARKPLIDHDAREIAVLVRH